MSNKISLGPIIKRAIKYLSPTLDRDGREYLCSCLSRAIYDYLTTRHLDINLNHTIKHLILSYADPSENICHSWWRTTDANSQLERFTLLCFLYERLKHVSIPYENFTNSTL